MDIQVIDCTLRDGGNLNHWSFQREDIDTIVRQLDSTGVDYIEIGYRGGSGSNTSVHVGEAARCSAAYLRDLPDLNSAKLAIMVIPSVCKPEQLEDLDPRKVAMIRVAAYPHAVDQSLPYVKLLHDRGFTVSMNVMAASYSSPEQLASYALQSEEAGAAVFYIADSYGSLTPMGVRERISAIRETVGCSIGFHGHNNLGLAFVNALEAVAHGATYIDTSLCGMARGAGNLPTEQWVSARCAMEPACVPYQVTPVLQAAEYVLKQIIHQPMKISTPEIICGLSDIHYYYYDLLLQSVGDNESSLLKVGRHLGKLLPHKVDPAYINKVTAQLLEA